MVIVWDNQVKQDLRKAYEYILQDSNKNALKIRNEIVDAVLSILPHPEKHPLDKYKKDNDGSWRAFELHRYRISYRIMPKEIRIVRMRHTSRSPMEY